MLLRGLRVQAAVAVAVELLCALAVVLLLSMVGGCARIERVGPAYWIGFAVGAACTLLVVGAVLHVRRRS